MSDQIHQVKTKNGLVTVWVRRDKRLQKSSRWAWQEDGSVLLRIPERLPRRQIQDLLRHVAEQLERPRARRTGRTDADLQARAVAINQRHFAGRIQWQAIRWVDNMEARLGSCTNGGSTDGHIRISAKIKDWPDWVLDYVIAHELAHRLHPNHSTEFWETLHQAYPLTEKARGFIAGVGFAQGRAYQDD
jgi:predicted metal-dependent hydrolase